MIKIIINGILGRMGTEIASHVSKEADMQLIGGIDKTETTLEGGIPVSKSPDNLLPQADLVIDFSLPEGTVEISNACLKFQKPLISGTTGLSVEQQKNIISLSKEAPVVQASNFSIGINLINQLIRMAGQVLKGSVDAEIVETHHRHKKDSPSGTALTLGRTLAGALGADEKSFQFGRSGGQLIRENEIAFHSLRGGSVVGEHQVHLLCENENIIITHQALSRAVFVDGILRAAKWIGAQPAGLYDMLDVLGFADQNLMSVKGN
jgi:4-hydroxy-tetrahydrodipicolinate reductase